MHSQTVIFDILDSYFLKWCRYSAGMLIRVGFQDNYTDPLIEILNLRVINNQWKRMSTWWNNVVCIFFLILLFRY